MKKHCDKCGEEISNGQSCYGITTGNIDEAVEGFAPDMDTPWVVLCNGCFEEAEEHIW